jgi:lysophospholipase L1-like esterase
LVVGAVLVALLIAELSLRAAGQSYYWAIAKRPDPVLGWRPARNSSAWQAFEGRALVRTNALGFRDRNHALTKADGVIRVAVLGDSFTEAVQVPVEGTWWRLMESRLRGHAWRGAGAKVQQPVEVLNFAVSGFSSAQALLTLREYALDHDPDLVVLAFFIGNDLVENVRGLDDEPLRPYLVPTPYGLQLDDEFLRSEAYLRATAPAGRARQWFVEHSRLAQLAIQARDALRQRRAVETAPAGAADPTEPGVDSGVFRPPDTPEWHQAWRTTEAILASFAREVREAGARPLILLIGTGAQVHPDAEAVAGFARALGVADLGYPVRRLLATADALRVPLVNLPAVLAGRAERDGRVLHGFPGAIPGFGHWNAHGHQAAAEAAAERLCQLLEGGAPRGR